MRKPINEATLLIWIGAPLLFLLLNYSHELGQIYIAMIVLWGFFFFKDKLISDKRITFPVERTATGRVKSFLIALVYYAVFLGLTTILMNLFMPGTLQSTGIFAQSIEIIKIQATFMLQSSKPILQGSVILASIALALLIPIVETILICGRMFESIYDYLQKQGVNVKKLGFILIVLFFFIGAISTSYHLTAKNLQSVPLMITFIFFTLSTYLVWKYKQLREAVYIHIIGNSLAVFFIFKMGVGT